MSSKKNENNEITFKILILGDSSVGKTSLLLKYADGYFPIVYVATIGIEYKVKKINVNGLDINLQLWDTAGQERFRSITTSFIKGADGIVFVYDITDKASFDNLKMWIRQSEEAGANFKQIIAGNKIDLSNERKIKKENLDKLCADKNIKGMEISAKEGTNINELFQSLAEMIIGNQTKEEVQRRYSESKDSNLTIKTSKKKKKKKFKC